MLLQFVFPIISMAACLAIPNCSAPGKNPDIFAVFAGTTPCNNMVRPIHQIPGEPDCEMVKCNCVMVEWKLIFYYDPLTKEPTEYKLSSINRFIVKETNMYSQPGTKAESQGKYAIIRGTTTNARAVLYRLNPDKPAIMLDLLKLNDSLLHIVDREGKLMIGNEFWSYTLNRVAN
jgi:hypothetical protein